MQAHEIGVDGLVCSAEEAAPLRPSVGARHDARHARHSPGGRCARRPETYHDAGCRDRGRRRLSGGRPADHWKRPIRRPLRRRSSRRSRQRARTRVEGDHGQGILDRALDINNQAGYDAISQAQCAALLRNSAASFWCAAASFHQVEGEARQRNVVIEFPSYDTALACYRSPEYQDAIKIANAHSTPISSSSRATTARSRADRRVLERAFQQRYHPRYTGSVAGDASWLTCG